MEQTRNNGDGWALTSEEQLRILYWVSLKRKRCPAQEQTWIPEQEYPLKVWDEGAAFKNYTL